MDRLFGNPANLSFFVKKFGKGLATGGEMVYNKAKFSENVRIFYRGS